MKSKIIIKNSKIHIHKKIYKTQAKFERVSSHTTAVSNSTVWLNTFALMHATIIYQTRLVYIFISFFFIYNFAIAFATSFHFRFYLLIQIFYIYFFFTFYIYLRYICFFFFFISFYIYNILVLYVYKLKFLKSEDEKCAYSFLLYVRCISIVVYYIHKTASFHFSS